MNRFYHVLMLWLIVALITAAPVSARAAASAYPAGVDASQTARGVYPGDDAGSCCWMGGRATFRAIAPMGADTLLVTVFIPPYAVNGDSQGFRARISGTAWQERCCYGAGMHVLALSLGEALQRPKPLTVELAMRETFVPAQRGLNADPRHLSVLLRGIAFENAQSGAQFGAGGTYALAQPAVDLALLVLGGIATFVLAYKRPIAAFPALILSDPFLFSYYVHGTAITLPKVVVIAAALALLVRALRQAQGDKSSSLSSRTLWLLLGAQISFVATMVPGSLHAFSHAAGLREILKAAQYALALLVAYAAFRSDPDERVARWSFAGITLLVSLLAIAEEFTGAIESTMIHGHVFARIAGPLEGPNQLAAFLGIMLPVLLAFVLLRAPLLIERIALAAGVFACVLTISRGGILALLVAVVLLLALHYRSAAARSIWIVAGTVFLVVLGLAFLEFAGVLHGSAARIFGSGDAYNGGLGSRPVLWHAAYEMWRAHPVFGVGPGNFELLVSKYAPGVHTHANGIYFQTLAEQGVFGALALGGVIAASITPFMRRLREPLALGACVAVVAIAFHQIVDCLWIYPKVGMMLWIVLGVGAARLDAVHEHADADTPLTGIVNEGPVLIANG